jgi:Ca2+-binding RTX toxin-like protein
MAVVVVSKSSGSAPDPFETSGFTGGPTTWLRAPGQTVTLNVDVSRLPAAFLPVFEAAEHTWESVSDVSFENVDAPETAFNVQLQYTNLNPNFRPGSNGPSYTLGLTSLPADSTGHFVPSAMTLSLDNGPLTATPDGDWHWTQFPGSTLYEVMVHELGHALGLAHNTTDPQSVMSPNVGPGNEVVDPSDIAGIRQLYGPASLAGIALPADQLNAWLALDIGVGTWNINLAATSGLIRTPDNSPATYDITGSAGNDQIWLGGTGDATASGGQAGTDTFVTSGTGNHVIMADSAGDFITATSGTTTIFDDGDGLSVLAQGGNVTAAIGGAAVTIGAAAANMAVALNGTGGRVFSGSGITRIDEHGSGNLAIGGTGEFHVTMAGQADSVVAGTGQSFITSTSADDVILGSGGAAQIEASGIATVVGGVNGRMDITAHAGVLLAENTGNQASLHGGSTASTVFGSSGSLMAYEGRLAGATFVAGAGHEVFDASLSATGNFFGGSASAHASSDLLGGSGADTLAAGAGSAVMTGGPGGDAFVFFNAATSGASDVITDFAPDDRLYLLGYNPSINASDVVNAAQVDARGVTLRLSDATEITFADMANASPLFGRVLYG